MKTGMIYKATNVTNGLSYIGQTKSKYLCIRISGHYNNKKSNYRFKEVLKRHKKSDFTWSVLESGVPLDKLTEREAYWIEFYGTYNNGYNDNYGGGSKVGREYHLWHPEKGEVKGNLNEVIEITKTSAPTIVNLYNGKRDSARRFVLFKNKDIYYSLGKHSPNVGRPKKNK